MGLHISDILEGINPVTIKRHSGPSDAIQTIHQAISARAHNVHRLMPIGGAPQTTSPLPVFQLTLQEAMRSNAIALASQSGWYYPIVGGVVPGIVHIREDANNTVYGGITQGILPTRLIQASYLADQRLGAATEDYEPRILMIAALHITALWLHGNTDYFIPLLQGDPPGSTPLSIITDMGMLIQQALAARGTAPSSGSTTPPN